MSRIQPKCTEADRFDQSVVADLTLRQEPDEEEDEEDDDQDDNKKDDSDGDEDEGYSE